MSEEGHFVGDDGIDWAIDALRVAKEGNWEVGGHLSTLDYFSHLLKPGMRMLDLGCNVSRWSPLFVRLGLIYEGLDPCGIAIDIARERYPKNTYYLMRGQDMEFEERFDFIFTNTVLQHTNLETKKEMIPRILRALKKGGLFIIQEVVHAEATTTTFTRKGWIEFMTGYDLDYLGETPEGDPRNGFIFKKKEK